MGRQVAPAVMAASSLFGAGPRTWLGRKRHIESEYTFLDRSGREGLARGRYLLDQWYGELPVAAKASIRAPFGEDAVAPHREALWELYLHEAYRRLGFEIDLDIGREDPDQRRPDFLLAGSRGTFHLEATAALGASVLGDSRSNKLAAVLRERIEEVDSRNFFVGVDLKAVGSSTPAPRDVIDVLDRWIAPLDPDEVLAAHAAGKGLPTTRLSFSGWEVECNAIPVGPDHRDDPEHVVLGTYGEGFNVIDDARPLRRKLKDKATHYGELEHPYVIALLCAGDFAEDTDIADALFGSMSLMIDARTGEAAPYREQDALWHRGMQRTRGGDAGGDQGRARLPRQLGRQRLRGPWVEPDGRLDDGDRGPRELRGRSDQRRIAGRQRASGATGAGACGARACGPLRPALRPRSVTPPLSPLRRPGPALPAAHLCGSRAVLPAGLDGLAEA